MKRLLLLSFALFMLLPAEAKQGRYPLMFAHRGCWSKNDKGEFVIPENSVAAVAAAKRMGYEGSEGEVHYTKDRKMVILHDATLNRTALSFVTAPKQAAFMEKIRSALNEEEQLVCRRGRNMPHANIPKSASAAEYSRATELEVLFGYLYLTEKKDRINELFALICEE